MKCGKLFGWNNGVIFIIWVVLDCVCLIGRIYYFFYFGCVWEGGNLSIIKYLCFRCVDFRGGENNSNYIYREEGRRKRSYFGFINEI